MTMQQVDFVPYNEEKHRAKYLEMGANYGEWLDKQVLHHYGVSLFQVIDVKSFMEDIVQVWSAINPPTGIILILEVDGVVGGMGRIDTWDEGISEVHNIWIVPACARASTHTYRNRTDCFHHILFKHVKKTKTRQEKHSFTWHLSIVTLHMMETFVQ